MRLVIHKKTVNILYSLLIDFQYSRYRISCSFLHFVCLSKIMTWKLKKSRNCYYVWNNKVGQTPGGTKGIILWHSYLILSIVLKGNTGYRNSKLLMCTVFTYKWIILLKAGFWASLCPVIACIGLMYSKPNILNLKTHFFMLNNASWISVKNFT